MGIKSGKYGNWEPSINPNTRKSTYINTKTINTLSKYMTVNTSLVTILLILAMNE